MSRDIINVQYPILEKTQSVAVKQIEKTAVVQANGITIKNVFENFNNSLMICLENTTSSDSSVIFKASNQYPNSMLGDLSVALLADSLYVLQVQDLSRFENNDKSLNLDFPEGFTGNIYVVAKSNSLNV